jgi:ferredoxin-NADP reductase
MKERRAGYAFSVNDRINIRARAGGRCEFPGERCERPNNYTVHHITGCYEGRLDNKDKSAISNASQNALMLCNPHALLHDIQEQYQVENLIWERTHKKKFPSQARTSTLIFGTSMEH